MKKVGNTDSQWQDITTKKVLPTGSVRFNSERDEVCVISDKCEHGFCEVISQKPTDFL